jgi:tetratricopeptide (TPR) repeat protein
MRAILIMLAMAMLAGCGAKAVASAQTESAADISLEAVVATASKLVSQGDYADAEDQLAPYVADSRRAQFGTIWRREALELYAQAAWYGGDIGKAHWAYTVASNDPDPMDPSSASEDWRWRMMSAAVDGDGADAYFAFSRARQLAPESFSRIAPELVQVIDFDFTQLPNAATAERELAEVLPPIQDSDPTTDVSELWLRAAAAEVQQGRKGWAANLARRITDPSIMAELRADRRFDELVAADPASYDPHALAETQLARAQAAAAANPAALTQRYRVATALYWLGRYREAIALLDAGLAGATAAGEDQTFTYDVVARKATILNELGRGQEALAITSAACPACGPNGIFTRQQAHVLLGMNKPADALSLLEGFQSDGLDAPGQAEMAAMRACALHGVGRAADAAGQLVLLGESVRADPEAAIGGMTCAGSDDEVAATIIALLNDPQTRDAALGAVQVYRGGTMPPLTEALRVRLQVIVARPDVRAALNNVGRISTYDMPHYAIVG